MTSRAIPHGPIPHGTTTGYQSHGCRCDECRAANTAHLKAWRLAKRGGVPAPPRRKEALVPRGLARMNRVGLSPDAAGAVIVLYRYGVSIEKLSILSGGSYREVRNILKRRKVDLRHSGGGARSLTDEQESDIARRLGTERVMDLAREFGVNRKTIKRAAERALQRVS